MSCRCCTSRCDSTEKQFGRKRAERDLQHYRRKGPDATSRLLLDALVKQLRNSDTVLDVGAGVGVVSFELLSRGAASATLVDESVANLDAAEREAQRRQVAARVQRVVADITSQGDRVAAADVVTMHRVVCCYPDHVSLLEAAVRRSRRVFAFSYPSERWYIRFWLALENAFRAMRGNSFRTFVHSPKAMETVVVGGGFRRIHQSRTLLWSLDVYERTLASSAE